MKQGCWVRGFFWVLVMGTFTLAVPESFSGFEIGNGTFVGRDIVSGDKSKSNPDAKDQIDADEEGKIIELVGPIEYKDVERTRLQYQSSPLNFCSEEEALNSVLALSKGWVEFTIGSFQGVLREQESKLRKNWTTLEMQFFGSGRKVVISLKGDKKKSKAYAKASSSLLSDVGM